MGDSYEVFLSFRGPDTRNNFTDHLYHGLRDAGIRTFRDDEELRQGEEIGPDLLAAIKNSQILIPVLSVNYGESKWCLEELVQIMECKKSNTGHIVLPVFYKVAPADVRYQKGSFGEAFNKRESSERRRGSDSTILEKWKQALREVGDLKGREAKGSEAELVKSIVQQVLVELKKKFELNIPEYLVGIDSHVEKVVKLVDGNFRATLFVGIHGMGGIGKTTLAKTIYNVLYKRFEHRSFIADVRESCKSNGIHHLQNQLISDILKQGVKVHNDDAGIQFLSSRLRDKKVLILLDDMDDLKQLKALAGNHNWFSLGSVIIITTRDKDILDKANVDYKHEHKHLDEDDSLTLFSRHAFRGDTPPSEFKELTDEVLRSTGGLPLTLEVLGSFLCEKEKTVWGGTIKKLRKVPHEDVQKKLRISYEALTREQKQIFLDIACFFIGSDNITASYMWDACDFFPEEGIEVLRCRSLIKVEVQYYQDYHDYHKLIMHDQLRDLGRAVVLEENMMEPGERSRLWDSKEALKMLEENEGTKKIEAIRLGKYSSCEARETANQGGYVLTGEQFKNLRNLRFLEASGAHFSGDFKNSSRKLKWLQWEHCPSTFEANNFCAEELAVLNLAESKISDEWRGWSFVMMANELKYLNLTGCESLEKTSFLSAFEKLEVLILSGCVNIEKIDSSIGKMKSLVRLHLSQCWRLKGLPVEVGKLEALEQLLLSESGISQLPDNIGDLQNLKTLDVALTEIEELPNDIGRLKKLRELKAWRCSELREMPESFHNLSSLQHLDLHGCEKLQSLSVLPSSLTFLGLTCQSRSLPTLSNQTHLKELKLHGCRFLECIGKPPSIPSEESLNTPWELEILMLDECKLVEILDVSQFNHLTKLEILSCSNIHEIRGLDSLEYLERLNITNCASIERLELPKSQGLKILYIGDCKKLIEIQGLDKLVALEEIWVYGCRIERLDLPKSEGLKMLFANSCKNLAEIRDLGRLVALEEIHIHGCFSIKRLDLTNSEGFKILNANSCFNLVEIQGLDTKVALEEIRISYSPIERLDLTKNKNLKTLQVGSCKNLSEIQGLHKLEFLEVLDMSDYTSFGRLPDLCCFDTLHTLAINHENNLHDIQSLPRFLSCKCLWIEGDKSLAESLNLSNFYNLETLILVNFHELWEISGLEKLTSLENMAILQCSSIKILPDLSSCTNLVRLFVQDCKKLTELRGLEKLDQLVELDISGCESLETIPELSRAKIGQNYELWPEICDAMRGLEYFLERKEVEMTHIS